MLADSISMVAPDLPVVDLDRARDFYEGKLGFKAGQMDEGGVYYQIGESGGLYLYQREATKADHTEVTFMVDDLDKEMAEMRGKGIEFEDYDMPEMGLKTVDGVATMGGGRGAWFKDTEGNILSIMEMTK